MTDENSPPVNAEGLRTDGPTLAEYVAEGYKAESYPPEGFAVKPAPVMTPRKVPAPINAGKTDALSVAARSPQLKPNPPEKKIPTPYHLSYEMDGEAIVENHATIEHALAGVRRLKLLGIVPSTSTDPGVK